MRFNLKSTLALLLCLTMILAASLSGCGKQTTEPAETTAVESTTEEVMTDAAETLTQAGDETTAEESEAEETEAEESETAEDADETTAAETTGAETTAADETTAAEETTLDITKLSTAQIVEKYNKAANDAKASSKSIKQNYCENTQVTPLEVNNAVLKPVANKLVESNMGRDKKKNGAVYSSNADKVKNFPVSGQSWASKLTADDVKSATITQNGDVSTVTIKVKDDMTPNKGTHTGKAFSLVTKQQIVDGAGSAGMAFIKEPSIALTYKNAVIKAQIDETTGRLISANYYIQWGLALSTTVGLDVSMYFGIEEDYTINW